MSERSWEETVIPLGAGEFAYGRYWGLLESQPRSAVEVPLIILVHGLGEHSGRYETIAKAFQTLGFQVLAYDHRGHGRSPGQRGALAFKDSLTRDLNVVVQYAMEKYPCKSIGLFGHSMGGLVVTRYLANALVDSEDSKADAIQFCVLSSPALGLHLSSFQKILLKSLGNWFPKFTVHNGLKAKWLSSNSDVVEGYVKDPLVHSKVTGELVQFMLESLDVVRNVAPKWHIPTFLVYASEDRCVDPSGSKIFAEKVPATWMTSYRLETKAHEVFTEESKVVNSVAFGLLTEWLKQLGY